MPNTDQTSQTMRVAAQCTLVFALIHTSSALTAPAFSKDELRQLADLSLEELMEESITSASKKSQKLGDTAAAVTILSGDDLRRSGVTNIIDALRLVPGMNVAAYNANQSAVTVRGFNSVYANKLLVMVDGRTVYTPLFSGVFWDLQQPMIEDIERIEVIRGPGATLWGANAVNGVINIITRKAEDTQGELVYAGLGNVDRALAGWRHGGGIGGDTAYRVFANYKLHDDYAAADGSSAQDGWHDWSTGFRLDHDASESQRLTWQGDFTSASGEVTAGYGLNTLARWTHTLSAQSNVQLQAYFDRVHRNDAYALAANTDTFDISLQYQLPLGAAHDVIWGGGYHSTESRLEPRSDTAQIRQSRVDTRVINAFVQDELTLIPGRLTVTGGIKFEHNDFTGLELAPNLRTTFKPTHEQTLWAAISRAVRTPSVLEYTNAIALVDILPGFGAGSPYHMTVTGNEQIESEILWAYEAGYRVQPSSSFNLDLAAYYNDYDRLASIGSPNLSSLGNPAQPAEFFWINALHGHTYGGEAEAKYSPSAYWRLTVSYALLISDLRGSTPEDNNQRMHSAPEHQASLGISHQINAQSDFNLQFRYVGPIESAPSYLTADVRFGYRLTDRVELSLVARNLLQKEHFEQTPQFNLISSEVPRSAYVKLQALF